MFLELFYDYTNMFYLYINKIRYMGMIIFEKYSTKLLKLICKSHYSESKSYELRNPEISIPFPAHEPTFHSPTTSPNPTH